jgi:integrase/recombinase XerD
MLDDLRRRNYSPDAIRGYIRAVQQFAEYFGRSPEQLGAAELRRYQLHLLHERGLALGTMENNISALRFLYKKTLKRRDLAFDDLPFPKQPRTLPTVLSQSEVTRLIEAAPNRMHRMLLMVLFPTGMRRTEASREPYAQYLQETLLRPLRLESSSCNLEPFTFTQARKEIHVDVRRQSLSGPHF